MESRTARALGAWKPGDPTGYELLGLDLAAVGVELLSGANYLFVKAHTKKGTNVPDPIKVPRIWRDRGEDTKRQSSPAEIAHFFGARMKIRYSPKEG